MYVDVNFFHNPVTLRKNTNHVHECDSCGAWFTRHHKKEGFTFCGKECFDKAQLLGGIINKQHVATVTERYGVSNVSKLPSIKEQKCKTTLKNYGVENPSQSPIVLKSKEQTFLKHYGVKNNFGRPEVVAVKDATFIAKYGVPYPVYDTETRIEQWEKSIPTRIKNGTIKRSKPEIALERVLRSITSDVQLHVNLAKGLQMDFHLPEMNLYIQVDGIMWHGLTEIAKGVTPDELLERHHIIGGKWARDRRADCLVHERSYRLARITDVDVDFKQEEVTDKAVEALVSFLNLVDPGVVLYSQTYKLVDSVLRSTLPFEPKYSNLEMV